MKKTVAIKRLKVSLTILALLLSFSSAAFANNISVHGSSLREIDTYAHTRAIQTNAQHSRDELREMRQRVEETEKEVGRLQGELARKPISWGNRQLLVKFSAGIAARRPEESEVSLISRADQALYEAKRVGKDRAIVAS